MSESAYYGFSGDINDQAVTRIASALNLAVNEGKDAVHLALSSMGGYVASGIYLYNHMRALPIPVHAYNVGSICSIAVAIFVAADSRYCSEHATFMIHPTAFPNLQGMTWERLQASTASALADDERTERILRQRTGLPDELLNARRFRDVHLSPKEALAHGLVHGVAEFKIPAGQTILQI